MQSFQRIRLAAACLLLGLASLAHAESKFFIYATGTGVEDFPGGTEDATFKPKKAAEVMSLELGFRNPVDIGSIAGGGGAGMAAFEALGINFIGEPALMPKIFEKLVLGQHYDELIIEEVVNGETITKISMKLCMFSSLDMTGTDGDSAIYSAQIEYGAVQIETWTPKPDGSREANPVVRWSRVLNQAVYGV